MCVKLDKGKSGARRSNESLFLVPRGESETDEADSTEDGEDGPHSGNILVQKKQNLLLDWIQKGKKVKGQG